MSLYAQALRMRNAVLKTPDEAQGTAVVVTADSDESVYTPTVYGPHGLYSMPPDDSIGIRVPVGGDERFGVILGMYKYGVPRPTLAKGEVALQATNAAGTVAGGKVIARSDGTLEFNGTGKFLVTYDQLNTALQAMVTAINSALAAKLDGGGTPGAVTLNITTAKAASLKTN